MKALMNSLRRQFDGIAMTPSVVAVYGASSLIAGLISLSGSGLDVVQVLVISTGITACATGLLLLAGRFIPGLRADAEVTHYALFALCAAIVGAARGVLLVAWAASWGALDQSGLIPQILNSSFSAVLWLTVAGLLFAGRERYRRQYRSLLIQGAISSGSFQAADIDLDTHPDVVQVRSNLSEALAIPSLDPSPEDLNRVAEAIRHEIEFNIRPLSHRLWFSAGAEEPHVRLSRLMRDALSQFTVPIVAVAVVWFLGALIGGYRLFAPEVAAVNALVSTVVLVVLLLAGRRLAARFAHTGGIWVTVSAAVPILVADLSSRGFNRSSHQSDDLLLSLLLAIALWVLIVACSMIKLAHADREVVLRVATRRSSTSSNNPLGFQYLSSYLHNSLQSELTGLAMQLESLAEHGDTELSQEALDRLRTLLQRSLMSDLRTLNSDIDGRVSAIIVGWQGICDVNITVAPAIRDDPRLPAAVLAAEELIANSVRHSGATIVDMSIVDSTPGVGVIGRANHPVPDFDNAQDAGIGRQLLRSVGHHQIQMSADGQWTRFELLIP